MLFFICIYNNVYNIFADPNLHNVWNNFLLDCFFSAQPARRLRLTSCSYLTSRRASFTMKVATPTGTQTFLVLLRMSPNSYAHQLKQGSDLSSLATLQPSVSILTITLTVPVWSTLFRRKVSREGRQTLLRLSDRQGIHDCG